MTHPVVTQSLVLLLIATTTSHIMPPPSFPYPYQQGQPPMHMMQMPNGPQMMQMSGGPMVQPPNGGPMMQPPNGAQMMQMPGGAQAMQMPNAPAMMPRMPRLPGMSPGPMNMPMPMSFPMNGGRLPMVVMPHRSKKADKHRRRSRRPRRKRINIHSSSSEGSCSHSVEYRRSNRNKVRSSSQHSQNRQVLTPVISYMTRDGYVVYQKKIKKDKARDWLEMNKPDGDDDAQDSREFKDKIRIRDHDHDH